MLSFIVFIIATFCLFMTAVGTYRIRAHRREGLRMSKDWNPHQAQERLRLTKRDRDVLQSRMYSAAEKRELSPRFEMGIQAAISDLDKSLERITNAQRVIRGLWHAHMRSLNETGYCNVCERHISDAEPHRPGCAYEEAQQEWLESLPERLQKGA